MVKGKDHYEEGNDGLMKGKSISMHVRESLERLGEPLPKLVAFDLDYTCWPLWVDTHVDSPLKRRKNDDLNKVYDRSGTCLSLFPHIPPILFFLQSKGIIVAAASRTCAPSVARQALNNLLLIDDGVKKQDSEYTETSSSIRQSNHAKGGKQFFTPIPAMKLFDQLEIYPGSKISHFRQLHEKTGIEYEDMIFFDDEFRNAEVSTKLGVHFELVGHQGTDLATFESAIRQWRAKKKIRQGDLNAGKELLE